jgi:flagellar biosynthesis/type III secretory pathway chaperone
VTSEVSIEMSRADMHAGAAVLGEVLATQRDLYRALIGVASNEQTAIVEGNVERLTSLVEEKEELLDHLRALETERMTALVAIQMATGIEPDTATLSEIASHLPSDTADALNRAGRELRAEALALEEAHTVNAQLLRNSRSLVDRWIHYLRTVLAGSLYTPEGVGDVNEGGRSLDRSA